MSDPMEMCSAETANAPWTPPDWLQALFLPDSRFARAYGAVGDGQRALLKGLIAAHYALWPPQAALCTDVSERLAAGLVRRTVTRPRPFVLLVTDASLDAPALLLSALMPALCSGSPEVLVLRLGSRSAVPEAFLCACELAGQERVAALSPVQAARLLTHSAASGLPGLVLCPDTPDVRRLLARADLAQALRASSLGLASFSLPRTLGLWRDAPNQFDPERVRFFFGGSVFEQGGARPGARGPKTPQKTPQNLPDDARFQAFAAQPRDLLLLPAARLGARTGARVVSVEGCPGLWTPPELNPAVFAETRAAFAPAF